MPVSVAILLVEASRIALLWSDGNAEAHACICNYNTKPAVLTDCMADAECSISIWAPTVALSLTIVLKVCETFRQVKNKRQINAFNMFSQTQLCASSQIPTSRNPRPGLPKVRSAFANLR